nr:DUF4381 family protein [Thermomonas flagellata]
MHPGAPPPWWPPAPGWWLLAAVLLALALGVAAWAWHRRRRRLAWMRLFDASVDAAADPVAQVAAMSDLLRRAARRVRADADRLQGEDWLALLDAGARLPGFRAGPGRLLLDGPFRPTLEPAAVAALRPLARARFLQWMQAR